MSVLTQEPTLRTAWDEPSGATPRGTVLVLPGRGENAAQYQRLGQRLVAENWKVRLIPFDLSDLDAARTAVEKVLADENTVSPTVLLGADAAATWASTVADQVGVDAVVLAGSALPDGAPVDTWEAELEARSACPIHRGVLARDEEFRQGALNDPIPADWAARVPAVPALVLHGDADPVTPLREVLATLRSGGPSLQVRVVRGGRHDVLNDAPHRSVAATLVLFLESLRLGTDLPEIVNAPSPVEVKGALA